MRNAVVIGASGLTGTALVHQLVSLRHPVLVCALVRSINKALPAKVQQIVVDGFDEEHLATHIPEGSWVFCCVGTTMRKAGSQEAFMAVDVDIPVAVAYAAKTARAAGMSIVSSAGAKANGFFFYTRAKGEMELEVQGANLPALHIFRPGFLDGPRAERRLGERLVLALVKVLKPFFIGPLAKYGPIHVGVLAHSMLAHALKGTQGIRVFEGAKIS